MMKKNLFRFEHSIGSWIGMFLQFGGIFRWEV